MVIDVDHDDFGVHKHESTHDEDDDIFTIVMKYYVSEQSLGFWALSDSENSFVDF